MHSMPIALAVDMDLLSSICDRYGIASLMLFGSVARGEATDSSDVDLLYTLRDDSPLGWDITYLNDELDQLFQRPVELVPARYLHPGIRESIMRDARPLYAA